MILSKKNIGIIITMVFISFVTNFQLFSQTPDPTSRGNNRVNSQEYKVVTDEGLSIHSKIDEGKFYYPTNLSNTPLPIVVIMHGRHSACYNPSNVSEDIRPYPCSNSQIEIPNHKGYDYLGEYLASHGFFVISPSFNFVYPLDDSLSSAAGILIRSSYTEKLLSFLQRINNNTLTNSDVDQKLKNAFGTRFTNKLNINNIGIIGHSRSGESAILASEESTFKDKIKAIFTLATTKDFLEGFPEINHTNKNIPYGGILGYCDGDVISGSGINYFGQRRNDPLVTAPSHQITLLGANHNYFNTVWTSFPAFAGDDWSDRGNPQDSFCGNTRNRLAPWLQRRATIAYTGAFIRRYLKNETQFDPILKTEDIDPPRSTGIRRDQAFVSYLPPANKRLTINSYDRSNNNTTNALNGAVVNRGLTKNTTCQGRIDCDFIWTSHFPEVQSRAMNISWGNITNPRNSAYHENQIPVRNQDFSSYEYITFRAGVDFRNTIPTGRSADFMVELSDGNGGSADTRVFDYSSALYYPPGDERENNGDGSQKIIMHTIKIPLSVYANQVDLSNVRSVRFNFGITGNGSILLADLMLTGTNTSNRSKEFLIAERDDNIKVFPNPTKGKLHINLGDITSSTTQYSITDIHGRTIIAPTKIEQKQQSITLNNYPSGVYILHVQVGEKRTSSLIVKED